MPSRSRASRVAPLLLGSGMCGLIYQIGWLREFRLIFGASTAASAAVLAIFIGGLGLGGLLLGRRADAARRPLELYGNLELVIAVSAAVSPFLLTGIRHLYIAAGGTPAIGMGLGTLLRLVLAALVLAIPTLAMGGTLAAATRAIASDTDTRRRGLALLYGTNTLGAVVGALASTFLLLEVLGTRKMLWVAALVNALIAIVARNMARKAGDAAPAPPPETVPPTETIVPLWFVLVASGVVGFAFFLMEMTWYRMLGPILGGTVFTFGLILAVALFGLGIGGLVYALRPAGRAATVYGLILTCVLEAIGLAIPLALGDRIAFGASALRATSVFGFAGQVGGWAVIACIVILPAAIASGVQFPLLVNLVGRGQANVGRQLGLVYATNTIGAIVGALLGGFVLLPSLGAVGCWRLAVILLLALGGAALALVGRRSSRNQLIGCLTAIAFAILLVFSEGPTAAWRHASIGAGRAAELANPVAAHELASSARRTLVWEAEGVESSVALVRRNGLAFVVNGKVDGNVISDAATQMMGGLVGAIIHPAPRRALVVGLGTGETAGWLADAPGLEHVDVIELERSILEVARRAAPLNRDVLHNPKVSVEIGDARETLLVGKSRYDIIFSEPSNPYRAGVSSLFTKEFYEAVRDRLRDDGLFLQWTQSYEVDGATIATIYATLGTVFREIHTFQLLSGDLLFVSSKSPIRYDVARIRDRVNAPAVREALAFSWHVESAEGFLSHFLGDTRLAAAIAERAGGDLNTDDRMPIEFAFARSLGFAGLQNLTPIRQIAVSLGAARPPLVGTMDEAGFDELRAYADSQARVPAMPTPALTAEHVARIKARDAYLGGKLTAAAVAWKQQSAVPATHQDALMVAEAFAAGGEATEVGRLRPAEGAFVRARIQAAQRQWSASASELVAGFTALRSDPFLDLDFVARALRLAARVADHDARTGRPLVAALSQPFAQYACDEDRITAQLEIAVGTDAETVVGALAPLEPHVPWRREVLLMRRAAYAETHHAMLERAEDDVREFYAGQPVPLHGASGRATGDATETGATSADDPSSP